MFCRCLVYMTTCIDDSADKLMKMNHEAYDERVRRLEEAGFNS